MLGARITALLASLLAVALASPAGASFSGSNGRVAWVGMDGGLYIDDPWDDQPPGAAVAQAADTDATYPGAAASAPQWSPDGTRLVYTEPVPDTSPFPDHSAVFVIDADGSGRRQVSHPFPAQMTSCDDCDDAEASWDTGPVWTPDGRIAFIRQVGAGEDAPHRSIRGTSVWTADPDESGETRIAWRDPEDDGQYLAIVWPEGSSQPYSVFAGPATGGYQLRAVLSNAVLTTRSDGIVDLDASPDGERLAFSTIAPDGGAIHVIDRGGSPVESLSTGFFQPWVRFTPDGNSVLRPGCAPDGAGQQHCGWIAHRLDDPEGDVRADDPDTAPYLDGNTAIQGPVPGARALFDIQSQDLPIVYLPGFLGSEIECAGSAVWMPDAPPIDLAPIRLAPDGVANATCPSAGPSGEVVKSFLGSDVYGHARDWLEAMDPKGGHSTFGWDWRRRPQASLLALDDKIDEMIAANEIGLEQGASRVSLVGHSYGGLLMRMYVDDPARAKKVARMLTVGSPFWGSPKPIFPLTFGIEAPGFGVLDTMIADEDLKASFRNFAGAYHLLPSDNFGPWLRVDGAARDQAGVRAFLESVGANGPLASEGRQTHLDHLDGFFDNGGKIDVRAVVGVGLLTPREVGIAVGDGEADVEVRFGDGDETVPARSANQGPPGTADPLGDDIHVQRRCGVPHMDQTRDELLQEAYSDFLVAGRTPRRLPQPSCPPQGKLLELSEDVPIPPPAFGARVAGLTRVAAVTGGPLTLGDAELAGLADVLSLPGGTRVVTNESRPVSLAFHADGWSMTVTDLEGDATGRRLTYGPMTGEVVVTPGAGDVPAVTVDGQPLAPSSDPGAPPEPGPGPGGDPGPGPGSSSAPPHAGGSQPGPSVSGGRLAASLRGGAAKVTRRGVVILRVRADAGTGTLVLRGKLGRRAQVLGKAKLVLRRPGVARVKVKLSRAAMRALRGRRALRASAVLTLRDAGGRVGGATARVTLKRA